MARKKHKNDPRQLVLPFPFPDSWGNVNSVPRVNLDPSFKPYGYPEHPFKRRTKNEDQRLFSLGRRRRII